MLRFACATVRVADAVFPVPPLVELTAPVVLVKVPVTELVTFTVKEHELPEEPGGMVPPLRLMTPVPATAVTVPPHEPLSPFGVATTTLAGNVSVNATPVSATVLAEGLVMPNVRAAVPFGAMAAGKKNLLITGGATTKMLAVADPPVTGRKVPVPSSKVAVILLVALFFVPPAVPVTLTEKEHDPPAGRFSELRLMEPLPGLAAMSEDAMQLPVKPFGFATTKPAGKGSLSAIPTSAVLELGLAMLNVSEVVPFSGMLAAPKALFTVGAWTTSRVAVLLTVPGPLSLAEIGPVVFDRVPVPVTSRFTVITQVPCATGFDGPVMFARFTLIIGGGPAGASEPPVKVMVPEPGLAVTVPPQVSVTWFGVATTSPAGRVSVNEMPVRVTVVFELLIVKLTPTVEFCPTALAPKSLWIVGGAATVSVSDAVLPVPPLVELTFPLVFV